MKPKGRGTPLHTPFIVRIVLLGIVAASFGACLVVIRNGHVKKGDEIHQVETSIVNLEKDIALMETRNAGLRDRADLARRLRWIGSDLASIDPLRILIVYPDQELPALPKVAAQWEEN